MERFRQIEKPRNGMVAQHTDLFKEPLTGEFYDVRVIAGDGGKFYCQSVDLRDGGDQLARLCETAISGKITRGKALFPTPSQEALAKMTMVCLR